MNEVTYAGGVIRKTEYGWIAIPKPRDPRLSESQSFCSLDAAKGFVRACQLENIEVAVQRIARKIAG